MQADQIKKFKDFEFHKNEGWKAHINTIYPAPNMQQLEKLKKKWYKNNMDENFDIN